MCVYRCVCARVCVCVCVRVRALEYRLHRRINSVTQSTHNLSTGFGGFIYRLSYISVHAIFWLM